MYTKDEKNYGLQLSLFGVCVCTLCIHKEHNAISLRAHNIDLYRWWVEVKCNVCNTSSCKSIHNHEETCHMEQLKHGTVPARE